MSSNCKIDLSKYYRAQPFIKSDTVGNNESYYWVQKRDNNGDFVENIYDVENDRFILNEWVDSAGHGLINADYINLRIKKGKPSLASPVEFLYNKINVKTGKLHYFKWLTSEEWINSLQQKDIIA